MSHKFEVKTYSKPTTCAICKKLLWGFYKQGRQCSACNVITHHKCIPEPCSKVVVPEKKQSASAEIAPAAPDDEKKEEEQLTKQNLEEEGILWNDAWQVLDVDEESENNSDSDLDELLEKLIKKKTPRGASSKSGIPSGYTGPVPKKSGIDRDFCIDLVSFFSQPEHKPLPMQIAQTILESATKIFAEEENIAPAFVPREGRLVVVGDTHGQYEDVLTIFELNGLPSPTNRFLFNGDFVDRGDNSVEIVLTLFAFKVANPNMIYLNRGNHEDSKLNDKYGFIDEVLNKYDHQFYSTFLAAFKVLPIGHLVEENVLIVHGGLPTEDLTISEIQKANRKLDHVNSNSPLEGLLWSDPLSDDENEKGKVKSSRGAGVKFGQEAASEFLKKNNLRLMVRSHQKMDNGYQEHFKEKNIITLFSASYYCGTNVNMGAYAIFYFEEDQVKHLLKSYYAPKKQKLSFDPIEMQRQTSQRIKDKIFQKKAELLYTYHLMDVDKSGEVSVKDWANGLVSVLKVNLPFEKLQPYFAKVNSETGNIPYKPFLDRFQVKSSNQMQQSFDNTFQRMFDKIYQNQESLSTQFEKFAKNGKLDYISFVDVIEQYNLGLSKGQVMELMKVLDEDNDGFIDYKEFIEKLEVRFNKFSKEKQTEEEKQMLAQLVVFGENFKKKGLDIKSAFSKFDSKNRGYLSYHDFSKAIKKLGLELHHDERVKLAEFVDEDKSETIEIEEFQRAFEVRIKGIDTNKWKEEMVDQIRMKIHSSKNRLQTSFRLMDTDGNGSIDIEEFTQGLSALKIELSKTQIQDIFNIIDKDKSGSIEWNEFEDAFRIVDMEDQEKERVEEEKNQQRYQNTSTKKQDDRKK